MDGFGEDVPTRHYFTIALYPICSIVNAHSTHVPSSDGATHTFGSKVPRGTLDAGDPPSDAGCPGARQVWQPEQA